MTAPAGPGAVPIGRHVDQVAARLRRAFDQALAQAGGSRPVWLVLLALRRGAARSQQRLAEEIGIRGATLTHHLTAMEERGLVARVRDEDDRRNQVVTLTRAGEREFFRLVEVAQAFDARLRSGLSEKDVESARRTLGRMLENVETD